MWIISLSGWCTSLQIVGKYLGMDTGFARERVVADWIVSVLIGIFTCLFRLALIYFPLLRIVGITTCICECFILLKTRLSALGNDIHAHNCICASDILYSFGSASLRFPSILKNAVAVCSFHGPQGAYILICSPFSRGWIDYLLFRRTFTWSDFHKISMWAWFCFMAEALK
jgi:hypothetical protein